MARKREIGFFNATHKHGEPLENLIAKLKAKRTDANPVRDNSLASDAAGWNRTNAPQGEIPPWVARQMNQPPTGIPEGVTPTKPRPIVDPVTGLPVGQKPWQTNTKPRKPRPWT